MSGPIVFLRVLVVMINYYRSSYGSGNSVFELSESKEERLGV